MCVDMTLTKSAASLSIGSNTLALNNVLFGLSLSRPNGKTLVQPLKVMSAGTDRVAVYNMFVFFWSKFKLTVFTVLKVAWKMFRCQHDIKQVNVMLAIIVTSW